MLLPLCARRAGRPQELIARSTLSRSSPPRSAILPDEDAAAYDELLARVSGGAKPTGVIEEILRRDFAYFTWEIDRWCRLKTNLLASAILNALERTLAALIPRRPSETEGKTDFAGLNLNFNFTPGPPSPEQKLAKKWAAGNPAAINRVNKLLASANKTMETVVAEAFVDKFDLIERWSCCIFIVVVFFAMMLSD